MTNIAPTAVNMIITSPTDIQVNMAPASSTYR